MTLFSPQRKNTGGFFGIGGTSFLEFEVRTQAMGWLVGRRYSDFVWLRNLLRKLYPTQIVPPIPEKKAAKRTQRHVDKRMRIL
jgi:sorting nexin-7/30/sorting nexin-8